MCCEPLNNENFCSFCGWYDEGEDKDDTRIESEESNLKGDLK